MSKKYSKKQIQDFLESLKFDMIDSKHDLPVCKYYSEVVGYKKGCDSMIKVFDAYYEVFIEEW